MLIAPLILKQRQWLKGILLTLLLSALLPAFRYTIEYQFFLPKLHFDNYKGHEPTAFWYIKNVILYAFYSYFLYGFIYFVLKEWYSNNRKQKELEREKIVAELAFLKSQINPHFLFNTLNDIYVLTYHRAAEAPNAVLKLSALLRYMLKESDEKFVLLQKEIDYLKDVIELHQIGQKGISFVNLEVEGEVNTLEIAPLILINFVENAFKHGVFNNPDFPIQIKLIAHPKLLSFTVENLKNEDIKDQTVGIGLKNVSRRLALIYPGKHLLNCMEENNKFKVELKIEWK